MGRLAGGGKVRRFEIAFVGEGVPRAQGSLLASGCGGPSGREELRKVPERCDVRRRVRTGTHVLTIRTNCLALRKLVRNGFSFSNENESWHSCSPKRPSNILQRSRARVYATLGPLRGC